MKKQESIWDKYKKIKMLYSHFYITVFEGINLNNRKKVCIKEYHDLHIKNMKEYIWESIKLFKLKNSVSLLEIKEENNAI